MHSTAEGLHASHAAFASWTRHSETPHIPKPGSIPGRHAFSEHTRANNRRNPPARSGKRHAINPAALTPARRRSRVGAAAAAAAQARSPSPRWLGSGRVRGPAPSRVAGPARKRRLQAHSYWCRSGGALCARWPAPLRPCTQSQEEGGVSHRARVAFRKLDSPKGWEVQWDDLSLQSIRAREHRLRRVNCAVFGSASLRAWIRCAAFGPAAACTDVPFAPLLRSHSRLFSS